MVGITYVYIDSIYGYVDLTHLYSLVGCLSMIVFAHMLFWVSYIHVFCIFVFALVQGN